LIHECILIDFRLWIKLSPAWVELVVEALAKLIFVRELHVFLGSNLSNS